MSARGEMVHSVACFREEGVPLSCLGVPPGYRKMVFGVPPGYRRTVCGVPPEYKRMVSGYLLNTGG